MILALFVLNRHQLNDNNSLFPFIHCFKTKHKLKDNVSLFSLVYYFKTFPLFSFNIIWFLSSRTSHSLYTYDHSHSCHPILIHMKLSKPRRMSLSFNLSSTPSQPHGSSSSPFSCLLL